MKKIIVLLALLRTLVIGQINNHFEHTNSKWYAARTYPGGNNQDLSFSKTTTRVYGFQGDTLINNVQWFKMYSTDDETFQTNLIFQGLMRAENKRVFFINNFSTDRKSTRLNSS